MDYFYCHMRSQRPDLYLGHRQYIYLGKTAHLTETRDHFVEILDIRVMFRKRLLSLSVINIQKSTVPQNSQLNNNSTQQKTSNRIRLCSRYQQTEFRANESLINGQNTTSKWLISSVIYSMLMCYVLRICRDSIS